MTYRTIYRFQKILFRISTPCFTAKFDIFARKYNHETMEQRINRIKVVLAEKQRTNKWLAENLGREYSTISKWCTNTNQPDLITLTKIAHLLEVDIRELLVSGRPTLKDSDFTSGSK